MGKIQVIGRASHKFDPDTCEIKVTIRTIRYTFSEATKEASHQLENLLIALHKANADIKTIQAISDDTTTTTTKKD